MKLSEAIKFGIPLRGESPHSVHGDRFCRIANTGELVSDAWGAACEAVYPRVAKLNWDQRDRYRFEASMNTVRAIQLRYFKEYQTLPARCPVAHRRFTEAGGRIINRKGETLTFDEKEGDLGGQTSECDKVQHMYGMVDHLFYAHGMTRADIAQAVEWYENTRQVGEIFYHRSSPQVTQRIAQELTQNSLRFLQRRKQQRGY